MIKNNKFISLGILGSLMFAMAFVMAPVSVDAAYSQIGGNTTLKLGSRGVNVLALQQLLASDKDIYPSGLTTSYFGSLTKAAVIQFQLAYNLDADGLAGAMTRSKANSVVAVGRGIDLSAPAIANLAVATSGRNVTVSFASNELVKTAVFYDTSPINWSNWNDKVMSLATPNISGVVSVDDNFTQNKQIVLSNLSSNTRYYYTVTATDSSGNTSVIWPSSFTTGQ